MNACEVFLTLSHTLSLCHLPLLAFYPPPSSLPPLKLQPLGLLPSPKPFLPGTTSPTTCGILSLSLSTPHIRSLLKILHLLLLRHILLQVVNYKEVLSQSSQGGEQEDMERATASSQKHSSFRSGSPTWSGSRSSLCGQSSTDTALLPKRTNAPALLPRSLLLLLLLFLHLLLVQGLTGQDSPPPVE